MSEKQTLVVVLSRNYSTGLSVVRSLGKAGYVVDLVTSAKSEGRSAMLTSSKYVRNSVEVVSSKVKEGEDTDLLDALLAYKGQCEEKPVLLPTDDYTASVMEQYKLQLADIFAMPGIVEGEHDLTYFMNKSIQCEIAERAGFLAPKCWTVSLREDEIPIPEDMVYPCYCKPIESFSGYKTEMARCNNREELEAHLSYLKGRHANRDFLVQEFLEIDHEIDIEGVAVDQDVILPGVVWKDIIAKFECGVPLAGKFLSFEQFEGLIERVKALIQEYHYFGMFDLGLNIVGDQFYFNEINLRSGGTNYVYFKSGVNLSDIFVKLALGQNVTEEEKEIKQFNQTYLYELMAYDDYLHHLLDRSELEEWNQKADIKFVEDEDDPEPAKIYYDSIQKRIARKEALDATVIDIMAEADLSKKELIADLVKTRSELNISYKDYKRYKLWQYAWDQKQQAYEDGVKERERIQALRNGAIDAAMEATGWDRHRVIQNLNEARANTGISYSQYKNNAFWTVAAEDQKEAYQGILEKRELKRIDKIRAGRYIQEEDVEYEEGIDNLVVVLSRNYSTGIAVIRSLGAAGYVVDLVASAIKPGRSEMAACSKYIRNAVECVSKKVKDGGDEALLEALLAYRGKNKVKPVLFATDDYTASIMDLNKNVLNDVFVMPQIIGGEQGSMTMHMDKTVQAEIARKVGLLIPREWIISLRDEIIEIPLDIEFPVFCKPIESITGYKSEMAKCDDVEELSKHLRKLKKKFSDRSILCQEFLEIDNEIDLGGVCLGPKVIIPAIIKKTNVAQYEKGVTLAGKVVPFEEMGDITDKVIAMLKEFHYFGMFDMEFNVVGDKLYFNEVNLRSGGPNFSYYMSGVNLPKLFVDEAMGKGHTAEDEKVEEYGKSFIYEKVAWDDHIHGFMSKKELDAAIEAADIKLLYNDDDPAPAEYFLEHVKIQKRNYQKKAVKRAIKNTGKAITRPVKKALRKPANNVKRRVRHLPQLDPANARNPLAEKPRVLVAGRNYLSNLCMAKSLGMAGYDVEVLRIFQVKPKRTDWMKYIKADAYSKYVKAHYVCVSRRKTRRIKNRLIKLADLNRKMLLIPCDDLVAAVIDSYYDELKEYYIMPNVNDTEGEVNRLMEKGVQKELARDFGLPVVGSCIIKSVNKQFEIPDTVKYPCFIKPNISKNSAKSKMKKCESYEDLFETLTSYAHKKDFEMIVEDFVDIEREFSILGVSTREGAIGPGYFGAVVGGQAEHRGVAVTGEILPVSVEQELIDKCVAFVGSLGFDGLYDIDLIQTADGTMYFVELNLRFGASGYAFTECGCNLPGMFADYMTMGKPIDYEAKVDRTGVTFVSDKVVLDEYAMGRIEKSDFDQIMEEADIHFIKSTEDPGPYNHYKKFIVVAGLVRNKNIKKREEKEAAAMLAAAIAEMEAEAAYSDKHDE